MALAVAAGLVSRASGLRCIGTQPPFLLLPKLTEQFAPAPTVKLSAEMSSHGGL